MTFRSEWIAVAARIDGLHEATRIYLSTISIQKDDPYNAADKELLPESHEIYLSLQDFVARRRGELPPEAARAIDEFLKRNEPYFQAGWPGGWQGIKRVLPALARLKSAVSYHLADFSAAARRLTERAFLHLQRSIVADPDVRVKWGRAFDQGEAACEKLGAAHLLLHGIWAFKAHSPGERTDLILGDQIADTSSIEAVAEALVLTEWKKISRIAEHERIAGEARGQCRAYAEGSLGGIELSSHRFIVLVSDGVLPQIPDVTEAGIVYRHVNVAVNPESPSKR